ncbi:hypothetical protein P9082_07865, partial [Gallibacterium anatis]
MQPKFKTTALALLISLGVVACGSSGGGNNMDNSSNITTSKNSEENSKAEEAHKAEEARKAEE